MQDLVHGKSILTNDASLQGGVKKGLFPTSWDDLLRAPMETDKAVLEFQAKARTQQRINYIRLVSRRQDAGNPAEKLLMQAVSNQRRLSLSLHQLTSIPSTSQPVIPPDAYSTLCRNLLGLPLVPGRERCVKCGVSLKEQPSHPLSCPLISSAATVCHNAVVRKLAELAQERDLHTCNEVEMVAGQKVGTTGRMDLLVIRREATIAIDVTISNSTAPANMSKAAKVVGGDLEAKHRAKVAAYQQECDAKEWVLRPMAISAAGGFSEGAIKCLQDIADLQADESEGGRDVTTFVRHAAKHLQHTIALRNHATVLEWESHQERGDLIAMRRGKHLSKPPSAQEGDSDEEELLDFGDESEAETEAEREMRRSQVVRFVDHTVRGAKVSRGGRAKAARGDPTPVERGTWYEVSDRLHEALDHILPVAVVDEVTLFFAGHVGFPEKMHRRAFGEGGRPFIAR